MSMWMRGAVFSLLGGAGPVGRERLRTRSGGSEPELDRELPPGSCRSRWRRSSTGRSSEPSRSIGTLRGWEQVTLGSKRSGRVVKVYHDIGDRVQPGEPLVELDPVDARLGVQQAESKYLGELVKLGITKQQAEDFVKKYGISEELLIGQVADDAIAKVPSVVQKRLAREKAQHNLTRQRALTQRGAGTPQELEDAENDWRTAAASYDDAVQAARTVIANAVASKVALSQAEQTLKDMIIRAPVPKLLPPSLTRTSPLSYGMTKRQVSEGQMIKEGEAVAELVIEDPIRLWSQVPEQYSEDVRSRPAGAALDTRPPGRGHRGQGRAHQPLGRLVEPHVPGRDAGSQRTRAAPARRLRQGLDHHRRRGQGGRRSPRFDRPVRRRHQALHRRERQGTIDQRHQDRQRRTRLDRGHEQAAPRDGRRRHHRPNPAFRRDARRDPRARDPQPRAKRVRKQTVPETAAAPPCTAATPLAVSRIPRLPPLHQARPFVERDCR